MGNKTFFKFAIKAIVHHYNTYIAKYRSQYITEKDVYVVWACKTLQNNKALLSTTVPDGRYYEITYNGDKHEAYLDTYVKESNEKIYIE